MLKYFTLQVTISTIAIISIPLCVNAGQIRLRTIKEGYYTKIISVDTGKPYSKPRYFRIIYDYPPSRQPYSRNIRRTVDTYIAKCDIYQMSGIIQQNSYDENNELVSLNKYTHKNSHIYLRTPTALTVEELALNVTCNTKK